MSPVQGVRRAIADQFAHRKIVGHYSMSLQASNFNGQGASANMAEFRNPGSASPQRRMHFVRIGQFYSIFSPATSAAGRFFFDWRRAKPFTVSPSGGGAALVANDILVMEGSASVLEGRYGGGLTGSTLTEENFIHRLALAQTAATAATIDLNRFGEIKIFGEPLPIEPDQGLVQQIGVVGSPAGSNVDAFYDLEWYESVAA